MESNLENYLYVVGVLTIMSALSDHASAFSLAFYIVSVLTNLRSR